MLVALIFAMGIANFAMHKAMLVSGHPITRQFGDARTARWPWTMWFEFAVLFAAMYMVREGWDPGVWVYALYTLANAGTAWMLLNRD